MYKNITLKLIIFYFKSEVYNIGNLDYLKELQESFKFSSQCCPKELHFK